MIIKPLEKPFDLLQMEALDRRIKFTHPKKQRIARDYNLKLAGFYGEKEIYYHLQFLPKNKYYILHNVRLIESNKVFQIDFIILSFQFIALLEVKNYSGKVSFNKFNQLVLKKHDGTEEAFENPVNQVERQSLLFQDWLLNNNFPMIPILPFVVFCSSSTLESNTYSQNISLDKIITGSNILPTFTKLSNLDAQNNLSRSNIQRLANALIEFNMPLHLDIVDRYGVKNDDLRKGIICPKCNKSTKIMVRSGWFCPNCKHKSSDDFERGVNDFLLIVNKEAKNRQIREFLNLTNPDEAKYLLRKSGYMKSGKTSDTIYQLELK